MVAGGPLSPAQLDLFEEQGFLAIPGLFSQEEARQVAESFERLEARARQLRTSQMHAGSQFVLEPLEGEDVRIHRIVWCGAAEPPLLRLGADPRLIAIAGQVLQASALQQLINQAHFKRPGDAVAFPFHQDSQHRRHGTDLWSDVTGQGSFLQIGMAVDPMRAGNGPLEFIPGSHKGGHIPPDPLTGELPPGSFDATKAVALDLAPGDLAIFGPYVVHGSGPNLGDQPRRLFLNGYAVPGANRRVYPGEGSGRLLEVP